MAQGGYRPGAGRKKGGKNKKTKEKEIVENELKKRVLSNAHDLLNAQLSLAKGCSFLYRIITNEKGIRSKPELITDSETIRNYLDDNLDEDRNEYYFITTEKPDSKTIDSLFDRTLGKPMERMKIEEDVNLKIDI